MKEQFENEMKLEFLNKGANEAFARITVAAFASQLDPTIEELADIKTAVSEAVTNCIIHAYENRQGIIKINAQLKGNEIIIQISDWKRNRKCRYSKRAIIYNKAKSRKIRNGIYNNGKLYGHNESRVNSWAWNKSYFNKNNKEKRRRN